MHASILVHGGVRRAGGWVRAADVRALSEVSSPSS
ncbi:hypothetical protein Rrhod_2502 [Rhodococcus rhodnii LMG 5362]|uniref:Uncharacterized protein n=1 Tax=Rhodococcus rhodnii LMG 5362 TaxID=1273125 RepID=R7WLD9_9NOCA|nr:hypothetical protein Rrhod_2502 [Rhodococcus rhodnii LMG 5362]